MQTMYTEAETRDYVTELLKYNGHLDLAEEIANWKEEFPVNGHDMKELIGEKRKIGIVIQALKDIWVDSDCKATKEELLKKVPDVLVELAGKVDLTSLLTDNQFRRKQKRV